MKTKSEHYIEQMRK